MTSPRKQKSRYRRARIRHFLFTVGPDRLSGGRLSRRHHGQDLAVRELEIEHAAWPAAFSGLRLGHVSDFHLGHLLPVERALEIVADLGELEPDLVAVTGDLVDLRHDGAGEVLAAIAAIEAPFGSWFVLGNHDELHDAGHLVRVAERAGVTVLRNDAAEIVHQGETLVVGGIDWAKGAVACGQLVDYACGDGVHLLLAHNPKAFLRAAEVGIPLTLAGHTHGGQIAMKNRPNVSLALAHRHRAGLFESGGSHLFVTTGVGAWFPLRVNCPAEIAMITVRTAE